MVQFDNIRSCREVSARQELRAEIRGRIKTAKICMLDAPIVGIAAHAAGKNDLKAA